MSLLDAFVEDELLPSELRQTLDGSPSSGIPEIFVAIRTDAFSNTGIFGDGTRSNPFAANTAAQFNLVMAARAQAKKMCVHLGPGLFRTEGGENSGSLLPFRLFDGMRIVGAGMFNTVLRLTAVGNIDAERNFSVIGGSGSTHDVEISDLTMTAISAINHGRRESSTRGCLCMR